MTDLRDYDRDALLIEKVRGLERQLADARASLDIAYLKGLADGRAERNRQNLREQEPVAWRDINGVMWTHKTSPNDIPLYESPTSND